MEAIYIIYNKCVILILFYKKKKGEITSIWCDMYERIEKGFWEIK